jgi:LuxR family maltose regulon positive regulatory protein
MALARARAALAALPADDYDWRAYVLAYQVGTIAYAGDELVAAERAFEEAAALARTIDDRPLLLRALGMRAFVLHDRGRLAAAAALLDDAWRLADALDARGLPTMRYVEYAAAVVHHDRGDLAGAERLLSGDDRAGDIRLGALGVWQGLILARVGLARGDGEAALRAIDAAEAALVESPAGWSTANHRLWTVAPAWRARIWAATGDLAAVRRWAEEATRLDPAANPIGWSIYRAVRPMLARARLLTGDPAGALALLEELRARAEAAGAGDALLELLALEALALEALGRGEAALTALGVMLELAEPEDYVRPFLDEGEPLVALLRRFVERGRPGAAYARRLLAAAGAWSAPSLTDLPAAAPLAEPLTAREREILELIAHGLSNRAVAERLFLTVGTVKWHLRTIYGKLGAERRTEAVARARALSLLH